LQQPLQRSHRFRLQIVLIKFKKHVFEHKLLPWPDWYELDLEVLDILNLVSFHIIDLRQVSLFLYVKSRYGILGVEHHKLPRLAIRLELVERAIIRQGNQGKSGIDRLAGF